MYSLTFHVRDTTTVQYGRNGTASLPLRKEQVHWFYRWCVHAWLVRVDYRWALPRISSVATATQPVYRLQIRPIVHK